MKSAFWPKVATMSTLVLAPASPLPGQEQDVPPAEPASKGEVTPGAIDYDVEMGYRSEEVTFQAGGIVAKAYLALPVTKAPGPFPGILVCPE